MCIRDSPILVDHFVKRYFRQRGEEPRGISPAVLEAFMRYDWPGNVRELENACERIAQTCSCGTVRAGCVPATLLFRAGAQSANGCAQPTPEHDTVPISLDKRVRALEIELITGALHATHGNKARAAELLQMNRSTLVDRMNRWGLGRASADEASELVSVPA